MDSYLKYYRDKASHKGLTERDRNFKYMQREFDRYFKNTLNRHTCILNGEEVELVFQDHSQSNNKDLSDDKYVIAPNDTPLKTGDYMIWQEAQWMVFTKEFKTILTHQQVKIKEVNEMIKWLDSDKNVSNGGKGWPAYAVSQTLYTMGVSENTYIPVVDSTVMLHMQDNPETRSLKMNTKLFVGSRAYLTKYINTVSRTGIITFILDETTINPEDNPELGIANYYSDSKPSEENVDPDTSGMSIIGEPDPKYGRVYQYTVEGFKAKDWILDFMTNESPANLETQDEDGVSLRFKDDPRFIGTSINLIAKNEDGNYITLSLVVSKKF